MIIFIYISNIMYLFIVVVADVLLGRDSSSPGETMNGVKIVKLFTPRSNTVSLTKQHNKRVDDDEDDL